MTPEQIGSHWRPYPEDWATYLPDLTDAATAGVILSWLPAYEADADDRGYRVRTPGGRGSGEDEWVPPRSVWSSTLGEAAVRAWLALGEGR